MAYDLNNLNKYRFFREFGLSAVDKYFIENIILPGLEGQGKFGGKIELPRGENETAEYLDLDDAAKIAIDWLEVHKKILKKDQVNLTNLISKSSYENLAIAIKLLLSNRVETPEKLLSSRLAANLAAMKENQDLANANFGKSFNPAGDIIAWNNIRTEVERLASLGVPANLIKLLVPEGLSANSDLTRARFIQLAINNLPELASAARVAQSDKSFPTRKISAGQVTRAFEKIIIETAPDFVGYLNLTKSPVIEEGVYNLVRVLEDAYGHEVAPKYGVTLSDWGELKTKAAAAVPFLIQPAYRLDDLIPEKFSFLTVQDQQKLSSALKRAIISTSANKLDSWEILRYANKDLGLSAEQLNQIHLALHNSGLDIVIEYHQNELYFDLSNQALTGSENRLRSKGINPRDAHFTDIDLLTEAQNLLGIQKGQDLASAKSSIEGRYQSLLHSDNPDQVELQHLRSWLGRHESISTIYANKDLRSLASQSRFERRIYNATSKYRSAETTFWNKWFTFEENLPWNKFARKAFETYEKIAEGKRIKIFGKDRRLGIISIPLGKGKKLDIPYLRLGAWTFAGIQSLKRTVTLRTYRLLGKEWIHFDFIRKGLRFSLKEYSLGGYNFQGALFHARGRAWGATVRWTIGKLGLQSAFKYSAKFGSKTVANAGYRTALRLILKIGGKAIAKVGAKALAGILLAATTIGSILGAISIISMAVDLLRLGYDLVRRFFQDSGFRNSVLKLTFIGSIIGGVVVAIGTGLPIVFAGIISVVALALGLIILDVLLAGGIALGAIAFVFIFYNMFVQPSVKIDPGLGLFQAIYCNQDEAGAEVGEGGGQIPRNAVAECATCLVEYLTQCYQNPITGSKLSGQGIGCLLAQAVAPDVAAAIQNSAVYYNYLQCVGFARAAAICGGGDLDGRAVASDYIRSPAAGYSLVSASSCGPGDLGLIDGAIGHIFVVGSNNGATITGIDANFVCTGCVSSSTPFPTTSVAGCMKRL